MTQPGSPIVEPPFQTIARGPLGGASERYQNETVNELFVNENAPESGLVVVAQPALN